MKQQLGIPGYERMLLPLLNAVNDGQTHRVADLADAIGDYFSIPKDVRRDTRSDGRTHLVHRIEWARTYLKKAGLVEYPDVGLFKITAEGRALLNRQPSEKDFLLRYRKLLALQNALSVRLGL
jgi:restriction system protein